MIRTSDFYTFNKVDKNTLAKVGEITVGGTSEDNARANANKAIALEINPSMKRATGNCKIGTLGAPVKITRETRELSDDLWKKYSKVTKTEIILDNSKPETAQPEQA